MLSRLAGPASIFCLLFLAGHAERHAIRPHSAAGRDVEGAARGERGARTGRRRGFSLVAALLPVFRASPAGAVDDVKPASHSFRALDLNGDGVIDRDEFMKLVPEAEDMEKEVEEKLVHLYDRIFQRADVKGDGLLNADELQYAEFLALEAVHWAAAFIPWDSEYDLGIPMAERLFADLDANGDGRVEESEVFEALAEEARDFGWGDKAAEDPEFTAWAKQLFARADLDGDGVWNERESQFGSMLLGESESEGLWMEKAVAQDVLEVLLDGFDLDGDEKIGKEELATAERRLQEVLAKLRSAADAAEEGAETDGPSGEALGEDPADAAAAAGADAGGPGGEAAAGARAEDEQLEVVAPGSQEGAEEDDGDETDSKLFFRLIWENFDEFDEDGDGALTRGELERLSRRVAKLLPN